MDWFTGSRQGEPKRLITQLGDVTRRDGAAKELIGIGGAALQLSWRRFKSGI
jgi:hypothetical protein